MRAVKQALNWILTRSVPNYLDAVYVTDGLEYRDLPVVRDAVERVRAAAALGLDLGDEELGWQLEFCGLRLALLQAVFSALHVFGRQQWPDPEKGTWGRDWIGRIRCELETALRCLEQLPEVSRRIRSSYQGVVGDPAVAVDTVVSTIGRILAPEFLRELESRAWPDSQSFP